MRWLLVIVAGALITTAACSGGDDKPASTTTSASSTMAVASQTPAAITATPMDTGTWKTYSDPNGIFSISYPPDWFTSPPGEATVSLFSFDPTKQRPTSGVNITIRFKDNPDGLTPDAWVAKRRIESSCGTTATGAGPISIGTLSGYREDEQIVGGAGEACPGAAIFVRLIALQSGTKMVDVDVYPNLNANGQPVAGIVASLRVG